MQPRIVIIIITLFSLLIPFNTRADEYFSTKLCESGQYDCIQVRKGETWSSLWPNAAERNILKRFNRMNTPLKPGMFVAIPDNATTDPLSLSPFPKKIDSPGTKQITVDLNLLAWAAYDDQGRLINWGPASGGKSWCYDINAPGKTIIGHFQIYDIRGENCISTKYPINEGGAPMPYCMFFQGGYALHGSDEVPGFNASHGCVRLFIEDAKWLNEQFARTPGKTKVLILPY